MRTNFKNSYNINERWCESNRVLEKYPDRIPIICEPSKNLSHNDIIIDKNKFLVPFDFTIGQFIYVIRKRMKLPTEKAIFLFINGFIPASSQMIGNIYKYHKEPDGFLYITYSFENTFG